MLDRTIEACAAKCAGPLGARLALRLLVVGAEENQMRQSILCCLVAVAFAVPAAAQPTPKEDGKGNLKPGQYAGVRKCLGSAGGVNIDVTSKRTIGVATCKSELQRVFVKDKDLCKGRGKREKVEYSWQFGEGEYATTGKHYFTCW